MHQGCLSRIEYNAECADKVDRGCTKGLSCTYAIVQLLPGAVYVDDIRFAEEAISTEVAAGTVPATVRLGQNVPNPFNPTTAIPFQLESREDVTLSIYDVKGRLVRTLLKGMRDAGTHGFASPRFPFSPNAHACKGMHSRFLHSDRYCSFR